MTYSDAIARGRGVIEWFVEIPGTRYVLGTSADAPGDAWYTGHGYSYLQGLRRDGIRMQCTARPGEVWPDVGSMDLEFQDRAGTLGLYLRGWDSVAACELTSTLLAGAAVANVTGTGDFAATGVIHCDHAAWTYSGKTATSFTGLALTFDSSDVDHVVDLNVLPPCQPEVTDGPGDLRGRRVVLHAAERTQTGLTTTEQVWIGYVDGFVEVSHGLVRIPVSHVLRAYRDGQVFGWVPTGRLRGLYVPNLPDARWGRFRYYGGAGWADLDIVADGTSTFYASKEALITAALDPATGIPSLADYSAGMTSDGRVWIRYTGVTDGRFKIRGYLPLILGFEDAEETSWTGSEPFEAIDWPADLFAPLAEVADGFVPRLYLRTGEAGWFDTASVVLDQHDGTEYGTRKVISVDVVNDYLEITSPTGSGGHAWWDYVLTRGGAPAPTVRQVIELETIDVHEVARVLWAGQLYAGAADLRHDWPARWLPSMALRDADVDWTELERLSRAAPWDARRIYARITEPTEVAEIIVGSLLASGIYAYVRNDGSVGWRMAAVPSQLDAATSVGSSWIDGVRCTDTETRVGADALLNSVKLTLGNIDIEETRELLIVDQRSLQRYGPQCARDPGNPLAWYAKRATDIELHVEAGTIVSTRDIEMDLARHLAGSLFALLSRPRPVVTLPVTPIARQLAIGDVVDLTTAWAWDLVAGQMGVSSKLGLVLGWSRREGERTSDEVTILLIDHPAGAIAPAALATAWDAGAKKLTFADTDLYHITADASDLTWFEAGDMVRIFEHDVSAPVSWTATVASVDVAAKEVVLTSAPGGLTVPAVMVFDDYATAIADQRGEGWIWLADDADGLVQDLVAGGRWG